ncbi:MAG: hypothetical protein PHP11_07140 [Erysipelotrichaceae bacterium]|nr:hypothetical protein [Erysipelotrichaceae bacterium]
MRVASSRVCLTPDEDFYLIGYGDRYNSRLVPAKGVHDDIFANVILIESNGKKVFIFNADFIEFEEEFCNQMKDIMHNEFGLETNLILFSATHNHQSVMSYHKNWKTGKFSQKYYDNLVNVIKQTFYRCEKNLVECNAFMGRTIIEGFYGSREHFYEKADNEVILVEFKNDERVIAGICNYATHSTVISPENDLLTGDLAGALCRKIFLDRGYYPAMIVGAAGDSSNRAYREKADYQELERISEGVAKQIAFINVDQQINIQYEKDDHIKYRVNYHPKDDSEILLSKINNLEDKLKSVDDYQTIKLYKDSINTYKAKLNMKEIDITLSSTIISMNDLQIISIPGELGSALGIELKEYSKAKCCLIFGYTNGHFHYILQPQLFKDTPRAIAGRYRISDVENYMNKIKEKL